MHERPYPHYPESEQAQLADRAAMRRFHFLKWLFRAGVAVAVATIVFVVWSNV